MFMIPSRPLKNFEMQKYCQNEPKFGGVYSRYNLPKKIKYGAYVINLDEYAGVETHWIALYALDNDVIYSEGFRVEHIPKKIRHLTGNKKTCKQIYLK